MPLSLDCVQFNQGVATLYVGVAKAADIIRFMVVHRFDPLESWNNIEEKGYQRDLFDEHIAEIQEFLISFPNTVFPTPIIARAIYNDNLQFNFSNGALQLDVGAILMIVDGQHRLLAIKKILDDNDESPLGNILLPFVIMDNIDKAEELRQFYLINNRQRKIQANLAFALLGVAAENDPTVSKGLVKRGEEWTLQATAVTIALNETSGNQWTRRVRYPGDTNTPTKVATINGLENSLKKFFKNRDGIKISVEECRDYISRFWEALSQVMPEAFVSPASYSIQRGVGAVAINYVAYEIYLQKPDFRKKNVAELKQYILGSNSQWLLDEKWRRGTGIATQYLGAGRPLVLARKIIEEMGLEPKWPRGIRPTAE